MKKIIWILGIGVSLLLMFAGLSAAAAARAVVPDAPAVLQPAPEGIAPNYGSNIQFTAPNQVAAPDTDHNQNDGQADQPLAGQQPSAGSQNHQVTLPTVASSVPPVVSWLLVVLLVLGGGFLIFIAIFKNDRSK